MSDPTRDDSYIGLLNGDYVMVAKKDTAQLAKELPNLDLTQGWLVRKDADTSKPLETRKDAAVPGMTYTTMRLAVKPIDGRAPPAKLRHRMTARLPSRAKSQRRNPNVSFRMPAKTAIPDHTFRAEARRRSGSGLPSRRKRSLSRSIDRVRPRSRSLSEIVPQICWLLRSTT